jgi:hypothetical protein
MPGLRTKPQTPSQIMAMTPAEFEWTRPDWLESFTIEIGSPDADEEEDGPAPLSRAARAFVRKHQRREARLRAKGRIA